MITQALGEIDYEEPDTYPKEGSRDYWGYDGTMEIGYYVFILLLISLVCFILGTIIGSSATVEAVKEHYCSKYTSTAEYKTCIKKPIQELYSIMEKH